MTVEYQETRWGRNHGSLKSVEPGTKVLLYMHSLHGSMIARAVRFDSNWRATDLNYLGFGISNTTPLVRDEITDANLVTSPLLTLRDILLWRRRHL